MKKIIKVLATTIMACVLAVPFAACTNNDGVDENGNVVQITMWVGGSEWSGRNWQNLQNFVNDYNKAKPDGFTVDVKRKDDLEKAFQTSRTNGKQPDVMLWDRFNTATNCIKGYLYPVDDLIERDKVDVSTFYTPAMQEMTYDGVTYGLPVDVDVWGTYVNMDYVEQYDEAHPENAIASRLTANWTWDDLLESAKALKTVAPAGYSAGDQEQHLFKYYVSTGHGEEYLLPANDGVKGKYVTNFDNEQTRKILEFFKEVKDANVGGKQEDDSFTSKQLAMFNKPLYYNNMIKLSAVKNYKFLPQPKPSASTMEGGVNGGMIGGYGLAYPAPIEDYHTKAWEARHEAAWKFTKWLCTEKTNMLKWSSDIGSLPALNEALNSAECVEGNQVLADARSYINATDSSGRFVYMTRPQVPNFLTLQTDVINSTVTGYISGRLTLDTCISDMTSNGNLKLALGLS